MFSFWRRVVLWAPLVLSIGLGLTVFSLAVGVDARSRSGHLSFDESTELRLVVASYPEKGIPLGFFSLLNLEDLETQITIEEPDSLGMISYARSYPARWRDQHLSVSVEFQNSALLPLLGVTPSAGRALRPEDNRDSALYAVVTDQLWRRLGQPPDLVGSSLQVQGLLATVVGRLPAPFNGTFDGGVDLVLPLRSIGPLDRSTHLEDRSTSWLVGLLRSDLEPAELDQTLAPASARLREIDPGINDALELKTFSLEQFQVGDDTIEALRTLARSSWLVLALCLGNAILLVAGLVGARRSEIATRRALGGDGVAMWRWAFARVAAPTLLGLMLAAALLLSVGPPLLRASHLAPASSALDSVGPLELVLAAAVAAGLLAVLVFVAHRIADRVSPAEAVRPVGTEDRRAAFGRTVLNTVQVALSLVIVTGTLATVLSVRELLSSDPGLDLDTLATRIVLPETDVEVARAAAGRLLSADTEAGRARSLGGPRLAPDATLSVVAKRPGDESRSSLTLFRHAVSDGYFEQLGIELRSGRRFDSRDQEGTQAVAVLSQSAAVRLFGEAAPLGKEFVVEPKLRDLDRFTVVGVVADVAARGPGDTGLEDDDVYFSFRQIAPNDFYVLDSTIETRRGDIQPADIARRISSAFPDAVVYPPETIRDRYRKITRQERFAVVLTTVFSIVALAIAGFGVLSSARLQLQRQRRSLAVRRALGAPAGQLVSVVVRGQVLPLVFGVSLGICLAVYSAAWANELLRALITHRPAVLVAASLLVCAGTGVAICGPLLSALRIDPAKVLKQQ